jgi:tetratricopeptide (TPR) repeat protein
MRYGNARVPLTEVARELDVGAVVQGSVAREADRVRITARLVDAGQNELWAATYERPAREILALQRDIVRAVTEHISLALAPQDVARLSRVRAVNPDVYEAYLKGRYHWNRRTQASLATAMDHFRAAIAADPTYAPAHVGLADCYNQLGTVMVAGSSPSEMRPRAMAAAVAALQIDPMLGEAQGALAYARHYDWQWDAAGRSFRHAVDLDPGNPLIHLWYANYLASLQRFDEAVAHVETARDLDPLSPYDWRWWGLLVAWEVGKAGDVGAVVRVARIRNWSAKVASSVKTVDLKVRPIHHRLADRVRSHIFLCMLAYYVEWHMRDAWRALLFADEDQRAKASRDPVAPARRSAAAERKALTHTLSDGTPAHSFRTLLDELSTIVRNLCRVPAAPDDAPTFTIVTRANPKQQQAFDLLEAIQV